ncbi:MAG: hypothetical protein GX246_09490 [Clostridiales bacterium]|jgi:hypothetical protein|nr:DUF6132 family protein [Bacillota bacterium]NLL55366.1 hypothetical protein [Clostridiales bacterium]
MKQKIKDSLRKNLSIFIGVLVGAAGGYAFYRFVGCASGACIITSNPFVSTVYGGLLGGLIGNMVRPGGCCFIRPAEKREEDDHG